MSLHNMEAFFAQCVKQYNQVCEKNERRDQALEITGDSITLTQNGKRMKFQDVIARLSTQSYNDLQSHISNRFSCIPFGLRYHLQQILQDNYLQESSRIDDENLSLQTNRNLTTELDYEKCRLWSDWRTGAISVNHLFRALQQFVVRKQITKESANKMIQNALKIGKYDFFTKDQELNEQLDIRISYHQSYLMDTNYIQHTYTTHNGCHLNITSFRGDAIHISNEAHEQFPSKHEYMFNINKVSSTSFVNWVHVSGLVENIQIMKNSIGIENRQRLQNSSFPVIMIGDWIKEGRISMQVNEVISVDIHNGGNMTDDFHTCPLHNGPCHVVILFHGHNYGRIQHDFTEYDDNASDIIKPENKKEVPEGGGSSPNENSNTPEKVLIEVNRQYFAVFATIHLGGLVTIEDICELSRYLLVDQIPTRVLSISQKMAVISGVNGLLGLVRTRNVNGSSRFSNQTSYSLMIQHADFHALNDDPFSHILVNQEDSSDSMVEPIRNVVHKIDSIITHTVSLMHTPAMGPFPLKGSSNSVTSSSEPTILLVAVDDQTTLSVWTISPHLGLGSLAAKPFNIHSAEHESDMKTSLQRVDSLVLSNSGSNILVGLWDRLLVLAVANYPQCDDTLDASNDSIEQRNPQDDEKADDFLHINTDSKIKSPRGMFKRFLGFKFLEKDKMKKTTTTSNTMQVESKEESNRSSSVSSKEFDKMNELPHLFVRCYLDFIPNVKARYVVTFPTLKGRTSMHEVPDQDAFIRIWRITELINQWMNDTKCFSKNYDLKESPHGILITSWTHFNIDDFECRSIPSSLPIQEIEEQSNVDSPQNSFVKVNGDYIPILFPNKKMDVDEEDLKILDNPDDSHDGQSWMVREEAEPWIQLPDHCEGCCQLQPTDHHTKKVSMNTNEHDELDPYHPSLYVFKGLDRSTDYQQDLLPHKLRQHFNFYSQRIHQLFHQEYYSQFFQFKSICAVLFASFVPLSIGLLASALGQPYEVIHHDLNYTPFNEFFLVTGFDDNATVQLQSNYIFLQHWSCNLNFTQRIGKEYWFDISIGHNLLCALYLKYCSNKSVAIEHKSQNYLKTYGPMHLRRSSRGLRALTTQIRKLDETSNIKTVLPKQIGYISGLQEIYARRVGLCGIIPYELGELTELRVLSMGNNHLTGVLPVSLCQLKHLQRIVLHQNKLQGLVPVQLGSLGCIVNLAGNPGLVHGPDVPSDERDALIDLYLTTKGFQKWHSKNLWMTKAPVSQWYKVGVLSSHVHSIVMSNNGMDGFIPPSILKLSYLRMIELATMPALTGKIPKELCLLSSLRRLCICRCGLIGEIPNEIGRLIGLEELQLFGNHLTGTIPKSLGQLKNLKLLSLGEYTGGNDFTAATIPSCIGSLSQLEALFMANCNLMGPLPDWIGDLKELRQLDLQRNNLQGRIPRTIGKLDNLLYLNLKDNELLSDPLPIQEICSLSKLNRLSLVHCNFQNIHEMMEIFQRELPRCKLWI